MIARINFLCIHPASTSFACRFPIENCLRIPYLPIRYVTTGSGDKKKSQTLWPLIPKRTMPTDRPPFFNEI
jgi:hypothetical protein